MTMRTTLALVVFSLLGIARADWACAQAPPPRLSGIWEVTMEVEKGGPLEVIAHLSFGCQIGSSIGRYFPVAGSFHHVMGHSYENAVLKWSGYEMRFAPDGNTATGMWVNGSDRLRSTWRRVLPQIDAIRVISQTKETVRLEVSGRKLFYFDPGPNAYCNAIYPEGLGMGGVSKTPTPGQQVVTVDVAVSPNTPAGQRFLNFDGVRLPWHWQGNVGPPVPAAKPEIVDLQFGRTEQGRFVAYAATEPMPRDRPFVLRARYNVEPPFGETGVTLTWDGGGKHRVPVFKSRTDSTVFESQATVFQDPDACRGLSFCSAVQGVFSGR